MFAGPAIAFNSTANFTVEEEDVDIGEFVKSTDFGGIVGAGVGFDVGAVDIIVDARYGFSFTEWDDDPVPTDLKNSGFSLMAGVSIPFNQEP